MDVVSCFYTKYSVGPTYSMFEHAKLGFCFMKKIMISWSINVF